MEIYQVHDKQFKPYISAEEIDNCVKRLASEIERDYREKQPLFIAILSGSFMFASDLFKNISIPAEICFIKLLPIKASGNAPLPLDLMLSCMKETLDH
jgi:hypoxanthine phosphoribosyltransferase